MTSVQCKRCGNQIRVTSTAYTGEPVVVTVEDHHCSRFLIGEFWDAGELWGCWTSDQPSITGPDSLVKYHAAEADAGWSPPANGHGWAYRWKAGPAGEAT